MRNILVCEKENNSYLSHGLDVYKMIISPSSWVPVNTKIQTDVNIKRKTPKHPRMPSTPRSTANNVHPGQMLLSAVAAMSQNVDAL